MADVSRMSQEEFARYLEYTVLPQRDCGKWLADIAKLVEKYKFGCVFTTSETLDDVVNMLGQYCSENNIDIGITHSGLGDTNGCYALKDSIRKCERFLKRGATGVDYVINIAELKNGEYDAYKYEIMEHIKLCHSYNVPIKVLHEAGRLTEDEFRTSCKILIECGADYIKTCSGFTVNPKTNYGQCSIVLDEIKKSGTNRVKLKASSGIVENVCMFIQMGAERVGSNASLKAIESLPLMQKKLFIH